MRRRRSSVGAFHPGADDAEIALLHAVSCGDLTIDDGGLNLDS